MLNNFINNYHFSNSLTLSTNVRMGGGKSYNINKILIKKSTEVLV